MYIGQSGVFQASRKPANILVVRGGRTEADIKNNQLLMGVSVDIGNYHLQNGLALFDTGSTETVLYLKNFRSKIGFEPYDHGIARGMNGDLEDVYYFDSKITLQCGFEIDTDLIDVFDHKPDFANMIIGMDIINKGKLIVDGKAGTFQFEI